MRGGFGNGGGILGAIVSLRSLKMTHGASLSSSNQHMRGKRRGKSDSTSSQVSRDRSVVDSLSMSGTEGLVALTAEEK